MKDLAKKVLRIIEIDVKFNTEGYLIGHKKLTVDEFNELVEGNEFKPYLKSKISESYFARREDNRRRISRFEDVLFWDRAVAVENYIKEKLKVRAEHDVFSCVTFNAIHYSQTFSIYKDIKSLLIFRTTITDEKIEGISRYEDLVSI